MINLSLIIVHCVTEYTNNIKAKANNRLYLNTICDINKKNEKCIIRALMAVQFSDNYIVKHIADEPLWLYNFWS